MTRSLKWGPSRSSDCGNRGWCFDAGGGTCASGSESRRLGPGVIRFPIKTRDRRDGGPGKTGPPYARSSMARGFHSRLIEGGAGCHPLAEIGERLAVERGCGLRSSDGVGCFFDRRGITFKNKKSGARLRAERPDVLRRRIAWFEAVSSTSIPRD